MESSLGGPIFKNVVDADNFVNISIRPLLVKGFSLEQLNHVLLLCFNRKRGVNPIATCVNVVAGEVRVSAGFENHIPEVNVFFGISHNRNYLIRF